MWGREAGGCSASRRFSLEGAPPRKEVFCLPSQPVPPGTLDEVFWAIEHILSHPLW